MSGETYCVRHHLRKLLEAEFPIVVLICLHDRLIHDLLQLLVLPDTQLI